MWRSPLADRRLCRWMDGTGRRAVVAGRRDQRCALLRPHDAARDPHSRGRASSRARPADRSFVVGALAAMAIASGNLVEKPLLECRLENADRTAGGLAAARPGALG